MHAKLQMRAVDPASGLATLSENQLTRCLICIITRLRKPEVSELGQ